MWVTLCLNFFPTTFIPKACKIFSKYFICKKYLYQKLAKCFPNISFAKNIFDTNISSWKYFINICSKGYKAAYLAKDVRRVMLVSTELEKSWFQRKSQNYQIFQTLSFTSNFGRNWMSTTKKLCFSQFFQLCVSFSNSAQTSMFWEFGRSPFLNR